MTHTLRTAQRATWLVLPASLLLALLLALLTAPAAAADEAATGSAAEDDTLTVSYFWGEGCPFCEQQAVFLDALERAHPDVNIERYEVWSSAENQQLMAEALAPFGVEPTGVPATVIGDRYWVGFNDRMGAEMAEVVAERSSVTVADEVSTGPTEDGTTAETAPDTDDAEPIEAIAAVDDGGSDGGVLIGLGVAVAVLGVGALVFALTRRQPAAARKRR